MAKPAAGVSRSSLSDTLSGRGAAIARTYGRTIATMTVVTAAALRRTTVPTASASTAVTARSAAVPATTRTGDALLAPTVTRRLIGEFARLRPTPDASSAAALATLTPRETQVLRLVAGGLSNPEIADHLVVTEETVNTHVSRVLGKLGLRDRTQAVVTAYESGLVVPGFHRQPG